MKKQSVSWWSPIPDYISADEMSSGFLIFDDERCSRCGICARICPGRSILMDAAGKGREKKLPELDFITPDVSLCVSCACCLAACPSDSITVTRGFNAGGYFRKISQAPELAFPKKY